MRNWTIVYRNAFDTDMTHTKLAKGDNIRDAIAWYLGRGGELDLLASITEGWP